MRLHANLQVGAAEAEQATRRSGRRSRKRDGTHVLSYGFRCVTREERELLRAEHDATATRGARG